MQEGIAWFIKKKLRKLEIPTKKTLRQKVEFFQHFWIKTLTFQNLRSSHHDYYFDFYHTQNIPNWLKLYVSITFTIPRLSITLIPIFHPKNSLSIHFHPFLKKFPNSKAEKKSTTAEKKYKRTTYENKAHVIATSGTLFTYNDHSSSFVRLFTRIFRF